ncbi:hypothetical protein [Micromonospora sp. WMMD1082]|uniref:hypothetical protein n=1 Tax=Micromonospora sp. WMMD1082 TaxID=3016104 RepID=UPI002415F8DF|nr:hypothetical protein [Micromonospora sp. WMMD1082]MDG4795117.1 hypothetical protein [Micromonospora sp. WMMD1082]
MSQSPPRPPTTRRATGVTSQFVVTGVSGRLVTAAEPGGRLTYVDLRAGTHGATLAGLTDAPSTAITTGLHAGVPAAVFIDALRHPHRAGCATGNPGVPHVTSLSDCLAQPLHHHQRTVRDRS